MKLNPQQQEAVEYLGGALFVLAGAGSGKTRVITEKIAYMITQAHYKPHHIAAITFTNKAAKEMQERIAQRLGKDQTRGLTVSTFHSLGMKILREETPHIGYKKNFSILDGSDSGRIIGELLGSSGREPIFRAQHQISLWKNDLKTPEDAFQAARETDDEWLQQVAQVYAAYQATLEHYQAVDFDDLIRLPTLLLQNNSDVRLKWQKRLRYLLVDECQDTNACQYALMRLLTGIEGMFTAVGDDDQSIYAWRGANMENLRRLQEDYPALKIIKLEQNYRSTARILKVANNVIANNPKLFPKTLWSQFGEGDVVRVIACKDENHEAEFVVNQIARNKVVYGADFADFAILYRGNHQARLFEDALRSARIPYQISGGQSFYDKAEIKDVLAYMRLLANPNDDPAFLRAATTPKRGIGDTTLGKLNDYAKQHECSLFEAAGSLKAMESLSTKSRESVQQFMALLHDYRERATVDAAGEVVQDLLSDIQYEAHLNGQDENLRAAEMRWRNVQDLAGWLERKGEDGEKNLIELTQTIALMTLLEGKDDEEVDAVKLSTLHASKGLEYPFVYLVGCEEGLFPHADSVEEGNLEEERRLMYVGITRAKQQLTLTHCVKRKRQGVWQFPEPSRFIDEMPQQDLEILGRKGGAPIVSKAEGRARLGGMLDMLNKKTGQ
ncbi:DNA helicase Rep [Kingella negevensis]|uniref:DNA helicase Rep n=1 Tax=Kingella negevensis TaxID=1522312 RepID=UPI002550A670|nr:DNA helicase Rep [Kingella negevensis]MDK4680008.1 DNA helicase Rep [Kingella negevensis]MDK4682272.1 DNA helicase Rep [Kingella negevensis]MDK4690469.1 DNA helicase Rep [Kingella negevensis]MDK4692182.1 DNA helicase Rep [Kingella negevensis]MDK4698486.1 DNA helicase Rep [Kingella negevensis]